jgi:DNA-binding transcriptional MerR regulator
MKMTDRAGRSIGEVLDELRNDFPDISVSKIRFLESQGLISPQRTPSGYRLFSDDDVTLLRWILLQQREHYLPLKVIRKRLREGEGPQAADGNGREDALAGPAPRAPSAVGGPAAAPAEEGRERPAPVLVEEPEAGQVAADEASWLILPDAAPAAAPIEPAAPEPASPAPAPAQPEEEGLAPAASSPETSPATAAAGMEEDLWAGADPARALTRAEVLGESGLEEKALAELESFGLLTSRDGTFDGEALRVARLAAGFFRFGVEARHLRMYKSFAEREAAFLEQVVMPMVNHRQEEESRARAHEALADLARLGQALRLSMLRAALGPAPGDPRAR